MWVKETSQYKQMRHFSCSDNVFVPDIKLKMLTMVAILKCTSVTKFMLVTVEHETLYNLRTMCQSTGERILSYLDPSCKGFFHQNQSNNYRSGSKVINLFMLDLTEHEISTVHKNQNAEKLGFLFAKEH